MELRTKLPVNQRVDAPRLHAAKATPLEIDELVDVVDIVRGDYYMEYNTWLKQKIGNYLWSGAVDLPPYIKDFGINDLWNDTFGEGIHVIVMDSGVRSIKSNITLSSLPQYDNNRNDNRGHGSLMAGIIAGNGIDLLGIAPACTITSLKIMDGEGFSHEDFRDALKMVSSIAASHNRCIVNCSVELLGAINPATNGDIIDSIANLVQTAQIIIVAAAGNHSVAVCPSHLLNNVVVVNGMYRLTEEYMPLPGANNCANISITAPGYIDSPYVRGLFPDFADVSGSSHACAYTSGLIALILSKAATAGKTLTYSQLVNILSGCTVPVIWSPEGPVNNKLDKQKILEQFKQL